MSLEIIKKLREQTGAGISDVKKALDEAGNDEQKAVEILRKAGQKIAAKKADRITNEGLIGVELSDDRKKGTMVAVACETDFVARNQDFKKFVRDVANEVAANGEEKVQAMVQEAIAKIGENIQFKQSASLSIENGLIDAYVHSNGKVGVLVAVESAELNNEVKNFAHEVALQVAALNPKYLTPDDVPQEEIEKEKEIYREQLKSEKKPDNIIENIVEGKVQKYYTEVCLLKQPYVKDHKITVEKFIQSQGGDVKIKEFVRFSL